MSPGPAPVAQQARSRLTQHQILEAAYGLIAEGGADALTMNAVAERAGVAVGSVYRRFGDKEHLLLAVQGAFANEVRDEVSRQFEALARPSQASSEELVAHAVRSLTRAFRKHEQLLRVFLILGVGNSAVYAAGANASIESNHGFQEFLASVEIAHGDRAEALDFAFRLLYAGLAHRVTQGENLESERALSWDDLEHRLATAVTRYLLPGGE